MTQRCYERVTKAWFHFLKEGREGLLCPAVDSHHRHVSLPLPNKGTHREISPREYDPNFD
jgi:hypothetical protein